MRSFRFVCLQAKLNRWNLFLGLVFNNAIYNQHAITKSVFTSGSQPSLAHRLF